MLHLLPRDLVSQLFPYLHPDDYLRLRAVCRELRACVDLLACWPDMKVLSAGQGLSQFVQRAAACRPQSLSVLGGVCWPLACPAFVALGPSLLRLRLDKAPVGQAHLDLLLGSAPNLEDLRIDNLRGGSITVPPPRGNALRRVDLRVGYGPDAWTCSTVVHLAGLRGALHLDSLSVIADKPRGVVVPVLDQLQGRAGVETLSVVHWGPVRLSDLAEYASLHTLVLHASKFVLQDGLVLPSIRRLCVPYRMAEIAVDYCPALTELYLYCMPDDDMVCLELEDIEHLPCLTVRMQPDTALMILCDTLTEYNEWLQSSTFRVLCSSDVTCSITSADGHCTVIMMSRTCKNSIRDDFLSDIDWYSG